MRTLESFVYIKSQKGSVAIGKAVDDVATLDGVMNASINSRIPGVVSIKHDAGRITGANIINHLKMNGYNSYQFGF